MPTTEAPAARVDARNAEAPPRSARARIARRALHGVLLLDKPLGWSSHDALRKAMALLRAAKGGHTGTLDPLATGLLPLAFGAATKFAQAVLDADKRYRATLRLGVTTTTGDREGDVVAQRPIDGVDAAAVKTACAALVGTVDQTPPMHSALKHRGRALYAWARAGVDVERAPRRVTIHAIDVVAFAGDELVVDVACSKGTYVRTLAEDLGAALGCGAHLAALRRTASGGLDVADALAIDALAALDDDARAARLLPPDVLLADRPALHVDAADAARLLCGLRRRTYAPDAPSVRVYGPSPQPAGAHAAVFLGLAHVTAGELIPDRLLSPAEVQALPG